MTTDAARFYHPDEPWRNGAASPTLTLRENYCFEWQDLVGWSLRGTDVDPGRFFQLMRNRLVVGQARYAGVQKFNLLDPSLKKSHWSGIRRRLGAKLRAYEKTGNSELLVDVSNYVMFEFAYGRDDGEPVELYPISVDTPMFEVWRFCVHSEVELFYHAGHRESLVYLGALLADEFSVGRHPCFHFVALDQGCPR